MLALYYYWKHDTSGILPMQTAIIRGRSLEDLLFLIELLVLGLNCPGLGLHCVGTRCWTEMPCGVKSGEETRRTQELMGRCICSAVMRWLRRYFALNHIRVGVLASYRSHIDDVGHIDVLRAMSAIPATDCGRSKCQFRMLGKKPL